jgi:hypothetical protein
MVEPIGTFRAEHESRSNRLPKVAVHVSLRILPGKLLYGLLRFDRQAISTSQPSGPPRCSYKNPARGIMVL